jgi:predicted outer membrane lipoprotein
MNIPNINLNRFVHAYKIAPWRIQRQWIGGVLLAVVVFAMIAALYLDVTAQAAIAGREIQDMSLAITANQQATADLETQFAALTSASVMEQRAQALGFKPMEAANVEYLVVPGYAAPTPKIRLAAPLPQLSAPNTPPEYTQSLLDWLDTVISTSPTRGMK